MVIAIIVSSIVALAALPSILLLCSDLSISFMESLRVLVEKIIESWKELLVRWFKK